ncbi:endonuclease Q family protein [Texcoconibacillus texcoconensis]|uniref:Uncharacterized protein (TIGR00375 family) n=1 Tax=Texcoconibacillus texcoconensis TaxID=1095777 RepID=A0A840QNN1_9BACI|nr:endonuclease Q family protein [Texcoconibacillus texcoconensis]MBB5172992.1 uncharacterized protein (TIGR00375 family) [Texcoconibacillus texcoconensis]
MDTFYADMHVHIGRTAANQAVKITASNELTLDDIIDEATERKGIDMIGIVDCHNPSIQDELMSLINRGCAYEYEDGGIRHEGKQVTVIPACEIEVYDSCSQGPLHVIAYFPTLKKLLGFTNWYRDQVKNPFLSTQRIACSAKTLQKVVYEYQGLFVIAHAFTPFKSMYGSGVKVTLEEVFDRDKIDAIELGLSADVEMASYVPELLGIPFLTNSDAHSTGKIAREYHALAIEKPTFIEWERAIRNENDRYISAYYGLNPLLGKYFRTTCYHCRTQKEQGCRCPECGSEVEVKGVFDRIIALQESQQKATFKNDTSRPPYYHHVPLADLPGIGRRALEKLFTSLGTEMDILHRVSDKSIQGALPERLAQVVIAAKRHELSIEAGGGGSYGRVTYN